MTWWQGIVSESGLEGPFLALATFALHSLVLLVGALALARVARSSSNREWIYKTALVAVLILPATQIHAGFGPAWRVGRTANVSESAQGPEVSLVTVSIARAPETFPVPMTESSEAAAEPTTSATPDEGLRLVHAPANGEQATRIPWQGASLFAWGSIALLLLTRLAWAYASVRRGLGRRDVVRVKAWNESLSRLARDARVRRPRLTVSTSLLSPVALGTREICVPARALTVLSARERDALLAHELAHVVRRDSRWLLFARALECAFFFQPLLRVVRRRLEQDIELECDRWAVQRLGDSVGLAQCLARVAEWIEGRRAPVLLPGMASSESEFVARIRTLLEEEPRPDSRGRRWRTSLAVLAVGGFATTIALAAPRLQSASGHVSRSSEISSETGAKQQVRVAPGDSLRVVDVLQGTEFVEEVQVEGDIMLPGLGRFVVGGLTRDEVEARLREHLAQYYDSTEVHVQIRRGIASVYIIGAVVREGRLSLRRGTTLMEAVLAAEPSAAGAMNGGADLTRVRLLRPSVKDFAPVVVDVEAMLATGDSSRNLLLLDGDLLHVPVRTDAPSAGAALPADGDPSEDAGTTLIEVLASGRVVSAGGEILFDPNRDAGQDPPDRVLLEWLQDVSRRMAKSVPVTGGVFLPKGKLRIAARGPAAFEHVQHILQLCGTRDVRIWNIELAVVDGGRERWMAVPLPTEVGVSKAPRSSVRLVVQVRNEGEGGRRVDYFVEYGEERLDTQVAQRRRPEESQHELVRRFLKRVVERDPEVSIRIDARPGTYYDEVVRAVETVQAAGGHNIVFVGRYER